jgi:6-phosphogluconolactonase
MIIKTFQTRDDCAHVLSDDLGFALKAALDENEHASLALSGGQSPKMVLPNLASMPLRWSDVDVTLSDERCVLPSDKDSNAAMVQSSLLEKGAEDASFHPLWAEDVHIADGLEIAKSKLSIFPWPLDVIYLGMGEDGHFASLFPSDDMADFDNDHSPVVVGQAPSVPHQRISLSLSTILKSRHLFLHVTGKTKRETFDYARTIAPTSQCPISLLLNNDEIDLRVYLTD